MGRTNKILRVSAWMERASVEAEKGPQGAST